VFAHLLGSLGFSNRRLDRRAGTYPRPAFFVSKTLSFQSNIETAAIYFLQETSVHFQSDRLGFRLVSFVPYGPFWQQQQFGTPLEWLPLSR
jgi:hypothetical protein